MTGKISPRNCERCKSSLCFLRIAADAYRRSLKDQWDFNEAESPNRQGSRKQVNSKVKGGEEVAGNLQEIERV